MKIIQNVLKAPIRNTVLIFSLSLTTYLVFALISLYLTRVMCAASYDTTESCRGTNLQMFMSMILNDFELIFRIVTEFSVVILITQFAHRLVTQRLK